MKFQCPAKINLFLKIISKRPDGYHELESVFAFIDLFDVLEVKKIKATTPLHRHLEHSERSLADKTQEISSFTQNDSKGKVDYNIKITGKFANFIDLEDNLFTKILDFFIANFDIDKNLEINLEKNIPVGAGLGGGSSNAAFFMKALNEIFELGLSKEKLQEISLNFGSDIAFFFENKASIIRGRGELVTNLKDGQNLEALMINPNIHLATSMVYKKFNSVFSNKLSNQELEEKNFTELAMLSNDLTNSAKSICPEVEIIFDELKKLNSKLVKMSGSGSTCFAIFNSGNDLEAAYNYFIENFPDFFVKKIRILKSI